MAHKKTQGTVVGVFEDYRDADRAVNDLRQAGFSDDQIGVATRRAEGMATATDSADEGSHWETGAVTGLLAGAGLGGLVGLGVMAGVIPVLGPIIAGGTLAAILANAAGGAAIGGVAGALIGAGIPEEEAEYYRGEFESGRTLVTVHAGNRADEATRILHKYGAYDMHTAASHATRTAETSATCATTTAGRSAATASGAAGTGKIEVKEERLHARKTPVEAGEVRVRKEVVTEHKTLEVPVEREEVVIERHAVGERATGDTIRAGEEVRIPVKEERVTVEKQPVVTEEVTVGKRKVQETEHVSGEVRKEQVKVERQGDVNVKGTGKGRGGSH